MIDDCLMGKTDTRKENTTDARTDKGTGAWERGFPSKSVGNLSTRLGV